jgi:hypothetical protein
MKKLALSVIAILSISLASNAQAFEKGGKYISLGLGGANFWHISDQTDIFLLRKFWLHSNYRSVKRSR